MLDFLSPLHFLSVNLSADMCVILSFHMYFISGILSVTLGPLRRYPESPNLCHNNTTRTTTPSVVFAQLVRLCQSVSNSLLLPFYCYSLPLFSFFALTWFVGSFVLCFASKGTSPMYPFCSLWQWSGRKVTDNTCNLWSWGNIKGLVHPKRTILPLLTHPHVVSNM